MLKKVGVTRYSSVFHIVDFQTVLYIVPGKISDNMLSTNWRAYYFSP